MNWSLDTIVYYLHCSSQSRALYKFILFKFKKYIHIYIYIFKQPRQDLGVCGFSFTRHSEKSFTQIYGTFKGVPLPRKGTNMHLRPEMHAVTKMSDLTKFRQTGWMFMVLTILANFSQIYQSEISLAELTILMTSRQPQLCKLSQRRP